METEVKPGWKTTEWWLTFLVFLLGAAMTSGLIGEGTLAERIIGGALDILSALGYTASRATQKNTALTAAAVKALPAPVQDTTADPP